MKSIVVTGLILLALGGCKMQSNEKLALENIEKQEHELERRNQIALAQTKIKTEKCGAMGLELFVDKTATAETPIGFTYTGHGSFQYGDEDAYFRGYSFQLIKNDGESIPPNLQYYDIQFNSGGLEHFKRILYWDGSKWEDVTSPFHYVTNHPPALTPEWVPVYDWHNRGDLPIWHNYFYDNIFASGYSFGDFLSHQRVLYTVGTPHRFRIEGIAPIQFRWDGGSCEVSVPDLEFVVE